MGWGWLSENILSPLKLGTRERVGDPVTSKDPLWNAKDDRRLQMMQLKILDNIQSLWDLILLS